MAFNEAFFQKHTFPKEEVDRLLTAAEHDLKIASEDSFPEVKFTYAYNALLKGGIALLAMNGVRLRSVPGHHVILIEKLAELLKNPDVRTLGNAMRTKRNIDMYAGGAAIKRKRCARLS